jgi:hypothetical protein
MKKQKETIVNYNLHDLPGDIVATTIRDPKGSSPEGRTDTILVSALELDEEMVEEGRIVLLIALQRRFPSIH